MKTTNLKTKEDFLNYLNSLIKTTDINIILENYRNIFDSLCKKPSKISKPFLKTNANSTEVLEYAEKLKTYETDLEKYNILKKEYDECERNYREALEDFLKNNSDLSNVPKQYRDKVYSYAYEQGHSDGYYSVFNKLNELCEIFS